MPCDFIIYCIWRRNVKKKVLMYVHYYYPDVASTAQIYTDLCEELSNELDITVICTVPSYSGKIDEKYKGKKFYTETINGVKLIRVNVSEFDKKDKISRIKNIVSYYFNSRKATKLAGKQDVVFTCSQPPILGGMLGVYGKSKTKGKLIYNIQDFNPEQTMAVKYAGNKLVHSLMMLFDKRSCRKSDLVITVGRDMQKNLEKRFNNKNVPKNIVINNWIDENQIYPLEKSHPKIVQFREKYGLSDKFVIMYSGNIGLYYDLDKLMEIIAEFKDNKDVVFAFVGDGAIKERLAEYASKNNLENVKFIPYQDKQDLIYSLNSADVHFVTNAKGIKGVSVPSKIYGILATNIPMIGILEEETEAWQIIRESDSGILAHTGNYDEIREKLSEVVGSKHDFVANHQTGYEYLKDRFVMDKSIKRYNDAIQSL